MKAKILIACALTVMAVPLTWANEPTEPQWDGQQVSTMIIGEHESFSASSGSSADTNPPAPPL